MWNAMNGSERLAGSAEDIATWIESGVLTPDALVFGPGFTKWLPANQVAELMKLIQSAAKYQIQAPRLDDPTLVFSKRPDIGKVNFFFMEPLLNRIKDGVIFRKAFAWMIFINAALLAGSWFYGSYKAWGSLGEPEVKEILALGLGQVVSLLAVYCMAHTMVIRGNEIGRLENSSFTIMQISAIVLRMTGEIYAIAIFIGGLGGAVMGLLNSSKSVVNQLLQALPAGDGFVGLFRNFDGDGVIPFAATVLATLFISFAALAFFYLLAEVTALFADIAKNIKGLREDLNSASTRSGQR